MHRTNLGLPLVLVAGAALLAASGCSDKKGKEIERFIVAGDYGTARDVLLDDLEPDPADRAYLYERMMLAMAALADGLPNCANSTMDEVYEILRTQGINADRTVISAVVTDRFLFWKGEPFEQAMLWAYLAVQRAMIDEWDNARAAAGEALFTLKNFGRVQAAEGDEDPVTTEEIFNHGGKEATAEEQLEYIESGYDPQESDFALGYFLAAIANAVLAREDANLSQDMEEHLASAVRYAPQAQPLAEIVRKQQFNAVLVVDYGLGPRKDAYGPDDALTRFVPLQEWAGHPAPLTIEIGSRKESVPPLCDLNAMAQHHKWNNMDDVRLAKSRLGNVLVASGAAMAGFGGSDETQMAGLAVAAVGLAMKASARADTTHCRIMPRSVFVAPIILRPEDTTMILQIASDPHALMKLIDLAPPIDERVAMLYVRMPPGVVDPSWTVAAEAVYANDYLRRRIPGDDLPYILGGRCVRTPSEATLSRYQQAGYLSGMTLAELEELYNAEGLVWRIDQGTAALGRHVLEGGRSLVPPQPGSAGYLRVFCQLHQPYEPQSEQVADLAASLARDASLAKAGAVDAQP